MVRSSPCQVPPPFTFCSLHLQACTLYAYMSRGKDPGILHSQHTAASTTADSASGSLLRQLNHSPPTLRQTLTFITVVWCYKVTYRDTVGCPKLIGTPQARSSMVHTVLPNAGHDRVVSQHSGAKCRCFTPSPEPYIWRAYIAHTALNACRHTESPLDG